MAVTNICYKQKFSKIYSVYIYVNKCIFTYVYKHMAVTNIFYKQICGC